MDVHVVQDMEEIETRNTSLEQVHSFTHCNALQHTATHCNILQYVATHRNILQRNKPVGWNKCTCFYRLSKNLQISPFYICQIDQFWSFVWMSAHRNTPQHTATHRNTRQLECRRQYQMTQEWVEPWCSVLQCVLQCVAVCCSALQCVGMFRRTAALNTSDVHCVATGCSRLQYNCRCSD